MFSTTFLRKPTVTVTWIGVFMKYIQNYKLVSPSPNGRLYSRNLWFALLDYGFRSNYEEEFCSRLWRPPHPSLALCQIQCLSLGLVCGEDSDGSRWPDLGECVHYFCFVFKKNFFFTFFFFFCSGFCHTLTWNSHGFTCVPHPDPPSHLPLHPILLGLPSAPGPSACLMHPTWAGDLFHPR